jgi:hypothetical protein
MPVFTLGIYFTYSIEAISVYVTEGDGRSLFNFLTRLCGVIGGIWVTTGLVYQIFDIFRSFFQTRKQ